MPEKPNAPKQGQKAPEPPPGKTSKPQHGGEIRGKEGPVQLYPGRPIPTKPPPKK